MKVFGNKSKRKPREIIRYDGCMVRPCNPPRKMDLEMIQKLDKYKNTEQETNFKKFIRYRSLFDPEIVENIHCKLYEPEEQKECKNPQKKCKNCSVYHGFKGSGRLYEQKTK